MSILGTIYTGLSGMLGFSKGLNVISDNVANMNTPGFKGSDVNFKDLFYQHHTANTTGASISGTQIGTGVQVANTSVRLAQGEIRNTGNQTDVAINGNGYFILLDDNTELYTRAGQFDFDADGYLISTSDGLRVAGINSSRQLIEINISDHRSSPPAATSEVTFTNNLSTGGTTHDVENIDIFDITGERHTLSVTFTNNNAVTPRSWLLEVFDESNTSISTGEIRFQGNGSPEVDFNQHTFDFTPSSGDPVSLTLNFGEPGSFSGATSFSGGTTSTLAVNEIDGYGVGAISELEFKDSGEIELVYSNEQTEVIGTLALAHFENQQALRKLGGGLLTNPIEQKVTIGSANDSVFGGIVGSSLELSNVELTQQFTDLVVIQRGFQSSSQVLTVANEMVQELINNTKGRG